jgi:hypothetical protein
MHSYLFCWLDLQLAWLYCINMRGEGRLQIAVKVFTLHSIQAVLVMAD